MLWFSEKLEETSPGSLTWQAQRNAPENGWTAFYVSFEFEGPKFNDNVEDQPQNDRKWPIGQDGNYVFTTTVSILPKNFPYEECFDEECYGSLV